MRRQIFETSIKTFDGEDSLSQSSPLMPREQGNIRIDLFWIKTILTFLIIYLGPNISIYALEQCNYSSALLFLEKRSISIFFSSIKNSAILHYFFKKFMHYFLHQFFKYFKRFCNNFIVQSIKHQKSRIRKLPQTFSKS